MRNQTLLQKDKMTSTHRGEVIDELYQAGLEMKRCQLKRDHPQLSDAALESLLTAWLQRAPKGTEGWATLTIHHGSLSTRRGGDQP